MDSVLSTMANATNRNTFKWSKLCTCGNTADSVIDDDSGSFRSRNPRNRYKSNMDSKQSSIDKIYDQEQYTNYENDLLESKIDELQQELQRKSIKYAKTRNTLILQQEMINQLKNEKMELQKLIDSQSQSTSVQPVTPIISNISPYVAMEEQKMMNNALNPVSKQRIELFISCRNLVKKDIMSKSDPFVVVYIKDSNTKKWDEIGRTEVIYDTHFPKFTKQFRLDYYFEEEQVLRFDVYDEDKKGSWKLKDHDILGSCTMVLGEIVHASGCTMAKKLIHKGRCLSNKHKKKFSSLIATVQQIEESQNELLTIQFSANNISNGKIFGKSDAYFLIQRAREDGKWITVHGNRENYIKNSLNPTWKQFQIETQTLCNNDELKPIVILIYDWHKDGNDDYIGKVETTLNKLKTQPQSLEIIRPNNHKKKKKKRCTLSVLQCRSEPKSSFLEYMQGNVNISLMVAIDFTGSNGKPSDKQSLHHIYGGQPSQYQNAIRQIGNIVSVYDSDQKFPVWGFGADFDNVSIGDEYWNGVKHDFNLNLNPKNPEVDGIFGVEECYLNGIKKRVFNFSGPTLFAPILRKAYKLAKHAHNEFMENREQNPNYPINYFILLIITDGIINDMKQTKDEIVKIANRKLPLSIIIVGVGNANFSKMDELDGDDHGLRNSKGKAAKRDIVQFVAMNKFEKLSELSKETLVEIPDQFLSYTRAHGIKPIPKPQDVVIPNFTMSHEELRRQTFRMQRLPSMLPQFQNSNTWDNAPLPIGWERAYDENGNCYYVDHNNGKTQWEHPNAPKVPST